MTDSDHPNALTRRDWMSSTGIGIAGLTGLLPQSSVATTEERKADTDLSITFNDQESDGRSVNVTEIETKIDAFLFIFNENGERIAGDPPHIRFEADQSVTDYEVDLDTILKENQELTAKLEEQNGGGITTDTASITVADDIDQVDGVGPTRIAADTDAGFNYPYYLYAPDTVSKDAKPTVVEPVNTGSVTDNFDRHLSAAKKTAERGAGRRIANALEAPFIVPVFPRTSDNPGTHYLRDDIMEIDDGAFARIDRQLLRMVDDARKRLQDRGYPVADGLMLNGFSAAGNFVNRFAALHPKEVTSVTAGGVNGMPILPLEQTDRYTLDYHLGIANFEALIGEAFDLEAFREVNQFLYMGEFDDSDTLPFWTAELRETALAVYGTYMIDDRFPYSRAVYDEQDAGGVFRVYEDLGHNPQPITSDLVNFHQASLSGEDITDLRADFGGKLPNKHTAVKFAPEEPIVGDKVAFDATNTELKNSVPVTFEWEFENGETTTGSTATYIFDSSGTQAITLTVTDDTGTTSQATEYVTVTEQPSKESDGTDDESTTTNTPGFGFVETTTAAVAAMTALWRYVDNEGEK